MELSLKGRNAVVCGSTRGIGLAIAKELALLGANCILFARNEALLKEIVHGLSRNDRQEHDYCVTDFVEPAAVKAAIESVVSKINIHILINNTGGPPPGPLAEASADAFENAFRQHIIINQLLTQRVLPGMKQEGYGRIINIISTSVKIPLHNLGVSNTIRAAVAAWAKTLSNEAGQYNYRVLQKQTGLTA